MINYVTVAGLHRDRDGVILLRGIAPTTTHSR
jgi:hypothetical protein